MIKKRLFELVEGSKKYIFTAVLINWIRMLCNVVIIFTVGMLLQSVLYEGAENINGFPSALIIMAALVLSFICNRYYVVISHRASVNAKKSLRTKIYKKLIKLGISYMGKVSTSEVIQSSVEGVEQLEVYFGRFLPQLFYSILVPVSLFVILSFLSMKSALVLLVCVPLIPVSIVIIMKYVKKIFRKYWGCYADLGEGFLENLRGLTDLKIYKADEYKNAKMNDRAEKFRVITMKVLRMQLNSITLMDLIAYGGAAVGIIMALLEYRSGNIEFWAAFSIIMLSSEFFIPLRLLGSFFHTAMNGISASEKIFDILDLDEYEEKNGKFKTGNIVISNVSFAYDSERNILDNINMEIPTGKLVSIVGESGSGKSTIARLIMGISRGYKGSIEIGKIPRENISEKEIMKNITLLDNNSYIFKGTVRDNLLMGKPDATEEEMKEALKQADLYDFIEPEGGLEYHLREHGSNLSGGQRQRLALSRALLRDSSVYIFDEATSNVDSVSEESIMRVIYNLAKSKTVILISHRLENVKGADKIYVMNEGKAEESGTHDELMGIDGIYANLYYTQSNIETYIKRSEVYA